MVVKCPVLLNNAAVTVILFNGKEVQIPAIKRQADSVNVKFENGKYTVVADDYVEKKPVPEVRETKKDDGNGRNKLDRLYGRRNMKTTEEDTKTEEENVEGSEE